VGLHPLGLLSHTLPFQQLLQLLEPLRHCGAPAQGDAHGKDIDDLEGRRRDAAMKPEIILIEPMLESIEAKLDADYRVHRLFQAPDLTAFVSGIAPRIRGIVTGGGSGASNALVDTLPALEIIAINGIGTDAVDLEHARQRRIRVTTTPDVLTDDVADLAIALLLATARQLCVGDRYVRAGRWEKRENLPLARRVSGKKLGILGMGRVGRAIAKRAAPFGLQIAYHDLRALPDVEHRYERDLEALARWCDFFVVAAAGGAQSRGVVGALVIDAVGPKGIVVNVARGSVVDEQALTSALVGGRLGGAGLDVFADEPNVPKALWSLDNVVLQPHRASATVETRIAMGELVLANLAAHFAGQEPKTAVV
jgi:hydroxypyruvate reductase